MTPEAVAFVIVGLALWLVAAILVAIPLCRMFHLWGRPGIRESDQESAAHCHAELDGAGLPCGLIVHFHNAGDTRG